MPLHFFLSASGLVYFHFENPLVKIDLRRPKFWCLDSSSKSIKCYIIFFLLYPFLRMKSTIFIFSLSFSTFFIWVLVISAGLWFLFLVRVGNRFVRSSYSDFSFYYASRFIIGSSLKLLFNSILGIVGFSNVFSCFSSNSGSRTDSLT